jgi:hypothetical protein
MTHIRTSGPVMSRLNIYNSFPGYSDVTPWSFNDSYIYRGHDNTSIFLGGHAVALVGFDSITQSWLVKNSWGTWWGNEGFFRIEYGVDAIASDMYGFYWEDELTTTTTTKKKTTTTTKKKTTTRFVKSIFTVANYPRI